MMRTFTLSRARLWQTLAAVLVTVATSNPSAQSSPGAQSRPTGQSRPAPEVLAKSLQQRYDGIHDFTADFSQTYHGGVLRTRTVEQGTVSVKKPGLMRWQYLKPEKKEFVANGKKTYLYIPQDRQVIVNDVDTEGGSTSSLFLAGKGDIARDFTSTYVG